MGDRVFIIDSARLPIGKYGGMYQEVLPERLGATHLNQLLIRSNVVPGEVEELIVGNIVAGGGNIARRIGLLSALPVTTPALTIDRQCASGLEAFTLAYAKIKSGLAELVLCGGVESTSRASWQIERPTSLYRGVPKILARQPLAAGAYGDPEMGIACEAVAEQLGITRSAQDEYALASQDKYHQAYLAARFKEELLPFEADTEDESPRFDTTNQKLARLRPVFVEKGTLTAGNSSPLNDGASFAVVASRSYCEGHQLEAEFEIVHSVSVGIDPNRFVLGPVVAIEKLLKEQSLRYEDIARFEINEAFAAQMLACLRAGPISAERVNVSGGALAFGHPFGATGAILIRRLMTELTLCQGEYGIVSLCVGGGQGTAMLIKRLSR